MGCVGLKKAESAGGVVFHEDNILLLKKRNGDWVLPKGHIEYGESVEETALREVMEESGISAEILEYLGEINYRFKNRRLNGEFVSKNVKWFVMKSSTVDGIPQKEEGFVKVSFFNMNRARTLVKHHDERRMINKAIKYYKTKDPSYFIFKSDGEKV